MPDNELQKVHNLLLSITGDNDKLPKAILQQCIKGSLQQTTLSNFQQTFWSGISQRTQTRSYPCSQYNRFHCNAIFLMVSMTIRFCSGRPKVIRKWVLMSGSFMNFTL